jgi:uncharacterized phage protein (TIGR01671 family)
MPREIKFRAWNAVDKIMGQPFTIGVFCGAYPMSDNIDTEGIEYMQYTGLVDNNGNEIYEGDIAEWHSGGAEGSGKRGIVMFERGKFFVDGFCIGFLDYPCDAFSDEAINIIKVIGNIYQNPELLNQ